MPFSVSAEGVSGSNFIIGADCYYYDYDREYVAVKFNVTLSENTTNHTFTGNLIQATQGGASTQDHYLYRYVFYLDNYYVGSIIFASAYGSSAAKTYYVNGNSFEVVSDSYIASFTVNSENLNRCDFDTWAYPIESFNVCSYMLNNHANRYYGINHQNDFMFPIFRIKQNDVLFATNVANNDNWIQTYIFYITGPTGQTINNVTSFNNNFTLTRGSALSFKTINRYQFGGELGYLCQVNIGNYGNDGPLNITYTGSPDRYYMPVYCNSQVFNKNVSTDFALIFDMSNRLLDYLETIAASTPESSAAEESLDDQTDAASQVFDNFEGIESSFNDDLTDSLADIQIQTPGAMGSKFQASAIWVKTQFDRITNTTPFGSILGFSLLLGISLLIVGRVLR